MTTGRPRKHDNHAARQKAYRARQAQAHTTLAKQAQRKLRKRDQWAHARYVLGTTAALLLRDAPPPLLALALDQIETGQYDKEWLEHGAPGPRFRRLIDYVCDVQAGRPLYTLFQGDPLDVAMALEPESVDMIITDLSPTRGR
jgi:hypothetical protein